MEISILYKTSECNICWEVKDKFKLFNCSHQVCTQCFPQIRNNLCPFCRKPFRHTSQGININNTRINNNAHQFSNLSLDDNLLLEFADSFNDLHIRYNTERRRNNRRRNRRKNRRKNRRRNRRRNNNQINTNNIDENNNVNTDENNNVNTDENIELRRTEEIKKTRKKSRIKNRKNNRWNTLRNQYRNHHNYANSY
jgi:hypothetical protein